MLVFSLCLMVEAGRAGNLEAIGVTLLRAIDPTLQGTGISVAQPEGSDGSAGAFQVNPTAVGQPADLFTYVSSLGSATNYPNAVGSQSGHANGVAGNFYGLFTGVAPQVAQVDNYDADYFFTNTVEAASTMLAKVVNQSFIFTGATTNEQKQVDALYDNYASQYNVLFVSGAGNNGPISTPATCYNGLGVAVMDGPSSFGPTLENGRAKPDLTAPGGATSFSTPYVAGAAAVLWQAGGRGDGGIGTTNLATDIRTIKALLLNGAIKPAHWTNGATAPLDARFGAGVVNVFNSYAQLQSGRQEFHESTVNGAGGPHWPGNASNQLSRLSGWDLNTVTTSPLQDRINHYYFEVSPGGARTLTATLVWNRQDTSSLLPQPSLNNLDLFLMDRSNRSLIVGSGSVVDNVEHIFYPALPTGRYALQVVKRGSFTQQSATETYALAFEIFALPIKAVRQAENLVISWPIQPTGFTLQAVTSLNAPLLWTNVNASLSMTNGENIVTWPFAGGNVFFRLQRP